jgi:hypothetical protein
MFGNVELSEEVKAHDSPVIAKEGRQASVPPAIAPDKKSAKIGDPRWLTRSQSYDF